MLKGISGGAGLLHTRTEPRQDLHWLQQEAGCSTRI